MLNGCDDGDLTVEKIDFTQVTAQTCSEDTYELLYKLKGQESLLLQMPEGTLKNETGVETFDINNSNYKLVYRAFDGTISNSNICDAIRPSLPNITNEWYATGGKIEITTTVNYTLNEATNSTRIAGYNHNIIIRNIVYSKPTGDQIDKTDLNFGDFTTKLGETESLSLLFDESALLCNQQVYNINGSESLSIENIDPTLIANTPTAPNTPRVGTISSTTNKVVFKVYSNGTVTNDYFCATPTPSTPLVRETWIAESGTIEVETSTLANNFKHIITFKNVKLTKGNVSFLLGNNFKSWELITTP